MDIDQLEAKLGIQGLSDEDKLALVSQIQQNIAKKKAEQTTSNLAEHTKLVIRAIKKIEEDLVSKFDALSGKISTKVASLKDGAPGRDGRDGQNGSPGRDGVGSPGPAGNPGMDGRDGVDGTSVTNARIDFDGSLVITLSDGREINAGEVVPIDLAERIKVITNGGGTSQYVLDTLDSLQTQINALGSGLVYKGTWNASTNTPTLASNTGTQGNYYVVSVAGSTNLNGITDWGVNDWVLFNGSVWQKIDNSDLVSSVNGQTGTVVLSTTDISEGTNQYFTNARARSALSAGTGITYSSTTGQITNSSPDQTVSLTSGTGISTSGTYPNFTIANTAPDQTVSLTGSGTTTISGTYPNFTVSSADQYTGTVTGVTGTSPISSSGGTAPAISLASGYGDTQNPYASKTANYVLASPNGTAGVPTFRAIVASDIPTLNQNTTGSAATLSTGRTISISGDLSYTSPSFDGSANVTAAGTLATVNANVGSFTYASITVNGKGLITAASSGTAPVTSVTATSPISSSGSTTPAISLASGYGDTQNPYASKTANYFLSAPNGSAGVPSFRAIVAADIPMLNQNTTGTASNVTGTVALANGGSGQTSAQAAMNAFAGAVTSGSYLRGNGTNVVMSTIQAADVPTLNQNTTGSAGSVATTDFTIVQSGTKLLFKYGATTIASLDSTGVFTTLSNHVANGTP
jgi:hypothetical protein